MPSNSSDLASKLSDIKLSTSSTMLSPKSKPKQKKPAVADSWEDELSEASDPESDAGKQDDAAIDSKATNLRAEEGPKNPPPTPASPSVPFDLPYGSSAASPLQSRPSSSPSGRPDKTTSVANRLIAGALGIRAPRRTEEEREYDRAVREKERRRRMKEREDKAKSEQAKKGMWED